MRNLSFTRICLCLSLVAGAVCGTSLAEEAALRNPGFEDDEPGRVPSGWTAVKASLDAGYRMSISDSPQAGQRCALIEREATEKQSAFGNLMQRVSATPFRGQRVRLRAAIKANVRGAGNQAQMWLRVDRPIKNNQPQVGHFDNMDDRPIIANEWRHYDIVADVAEDAQSLNLGVFLLGSGKVWLDDVSLEVVGKDVPVTGRELPARVPPAAPGLFEVLGAMEVLRLNEVAGTDSEAENVPDEETVLIPLPLAYRDQSPLTYELTVVPPEAAGGVSLYEDKPTNFVAKLTLKNWKPHRTVSVKFRSLVLVQPSQFEAVPKSAMIVVAHPDDAEFIAAGTVAKWSNAGSHVTYVVVTKGDKGSDDPEVTPSQLAQIRESEQRDAGRILGVSDFVFMGYPDGYLQHTLELRRDLARVIRSYRPEVVICYDPTNRFLTDTYVNHPDHRASGDATIDAVFPTARDRLTFPELLADGLEPHKVAQLWLAAPGQPNTVVDIGDTLELKCKALLAHPSQLGEDVVNFARDLARWMAEGQDFEFGESFRRFILESESY